MPAKSKQQQRFMGMVHACKTGKGSCEGEVGKVAKQIKDKDAKKFAETKHKGLPEKKVKETLTLTFKQFLSELDQ